MQLRECGRHGVPVVLAVAFTLGFAMPVCAGAPGEGDAAPGIEERTRKGLPQRTGNMQVPGLRDTVEVLRDRWGIAHIYAKSTHDLFFAQGFLAAQTRMWQIEMWRRTAEGRLAEVLGPAYVGRDRFARALAYRGDWDAELRYYHPEGPVIFTAFANGINAAIRDALAHDRIPVEFELSGFRPEPVWTVRTVLTRAAGAATARGASHELQYALAVKSLGLQKTRDLLPGNPPATLEIPQGLDLADITPNILDALQGVYGGGWKFPAGVNLPSGASLDPHADLTGSNNWVVGGRKTVTGKPLLASDPHRAVDNPAMRYWVHLVAPGWNLMGMIDAGHPGISIGHNEHIAWGWTNLSADTQDLYVEEIDPARPDHYRYKGEWRRMRTYPEEIGIKGQAPLRVDVKMTVHGPVIHEDGERRRAYALRMPGAETGGAGYSLGALAVAQAENWEEFLKGCAKWATAQGTVYADTRGNFGFLPVGWIPRRPNWDGLFPVPGKDGLHEWAGYIPASEMPRTLNDERGFYASANSDVLSGLSLGDPARFGHVYGPPYRFDRIMEVLGQPKKLSVSDLQALQFDVASLPARRLVPLLKEVRTDDARIRWAIDQLSGWNLSLDADSVPATLYEFWRLRLTALTYAIKVPAAASGEGLAKDLGRVIAWLTAPDADFGPDPRARRDEILLTALVQALERIEAKAGPDRDRWKWGDLHQARFAHPLLTPGSASMFSIPPVRQGGDEFTVHAAGGVSEERMDHTHGASIMFVLDTADWDRSVGLNAPGNEAHVGSPHYRDLAAGWRGGEHFPLAYSREKVLQVLGERLTLSGGKSK
jgi:penicillin amidase